MLARVSPFSSSRARARPRSSSFASPSGVIMMFDGLMSRWTSPASMGRLEAVDHLEEQPGRVGHAQRAAAFVLDDVEEALARDVLHHHEVDVAFAAHRRACGRGSGCEQRRERSISRRNRCRAFSSSSALRGGSTLIATCSPSVVDGQVDLPHPAFAEGSEQPVAAQEEPARGARRGASWPDRSSASRPAISRRASRTAASSAGLGVELRSDPRQDLGRNQSRLGDVGR